MGNWRQQGYVRVAKRLYDDNMYRFDLAQPSYWEATATAEAPAATPLAGDATCDVAVIGGGYTGLSAARHLARDASLSVRVLEAGHLGWGASGRNGGFCTMGGAAADSRTLLSRYGLDEVRRYYRSQVDAVELVRDILDEEKIDAHVQGDAELEVAHTPGAWRELQEHAAWQKSALGLDAACMPAGEFRERYFDSEEQHGASIVRPTFGLHPLNYLRGLARAAMRHGATLHPHSEVTGWQHDAGRHLLTTRKGTVRARHVIVATNGFVPEALHPSLHGNALPVISAIIVSRPLTDEEMSVYSWRTECPAISSRHLLNYFRLLPDRRLLFGGRGHSNGSTVGCAETFRSLEAARNRIWPGWQDVGIDYRWHGLICMTRRRTPVIARAADVPGVFMGYGFHGNGVNTATWAGKQLAAWLIDSAAGADRYEQSLPAMVRGAAKGFPLPRLRLWYLKAALAAYAMQDRMA